MPVLWLLIILGVALLWLLLSCLYRPIGKFFKRLFKDASDEMNREDEEK